MSGIKFKGDTSGEILLETPAVAGTNTLTLPAETGTLATTTEINNVIYKNLGTRNFIINGDMKIAQRATSVANVTGGNYYTVDRWQWVKVGSATLDMDQSTDVPAGQGFTNSVKLTVNTADTAIGATDYSYYRQPIEGNNIAQLEFGNAYAKTITLSFWVKSSITGTYCATLHNNDFSRHYIAEYTIDTADTWEKKTITVVGDTTGTWATDNTRGLILHFALATGADYQGSLGWQGDGVKLGSTNQVNWLGTTGSTLYLTGIQLEAGEEATPFEHVPVDISLNRCRRYFLKKYLSHKLVVVYSNGDTRGHQEHIGIMRDRPIMSGERLTDLGNNENVSWGVFTQHSLNFSSAGTKINAPTDSWKLQAIAYEHQYGNVDGTIGKDICLRYGHEGGAIEGYSGSLNLIAINIVGTVNFDAEL